MEKIKKHIISILVFVLNVALLIVGIFLIKAKEKIPAIDDKNMTSEILPVSEEAESLPEITTPDQTNIIKEADELTKETELNPEPLKKSSALQTTVAPEVKPKAKKSTTKTRSS